MMAYWVDQVGDPPRERWVEIRPQDLVDPCLLGQNDRPGPFLVVRPQARLAEVGERPVADIMDHGRRQHRRATVARLVIVAGEPAQVLPFDRKREVVSA